MNCSPLINILVFIALVSIAAGSRLVGAPPNFAAVAAAALFAGFFFSSRLVAIAVPITAMLIADCVHGTYDARQMIVVYAMLAMPVLFRIGGQASSAPRWFAGVLGATALCSLTFFMFTNLAVWAFGTMYTHDLAGLARCYELALPFFRFTLVGDLVFATVFFGVHRLAMSRAADGPVLATA